MQRSTFNVAKYRAESAGSRREACAIVSAGIRIFALYRGDISSTVRARQMKTESSMLPATVVSPARFSMGVVGAWLALCVIWSSTWLAIKIGLRDFPPISFVAFRFIIAAGVLAGICAGRFRFFPRHLADYSFLAFTGILTFAINYGLLFWGEQHVSSGLAAILQATIPMFGLVFAHFLLPSEPLKWERVLGAILALAGVAIICAKLLDFQGIMAFWGGVAIVAGAASAAYASVAVKTRATQFAPAVMAAWQMIFALGPLILVSLWSEGNPVHFHWSKVAVGCLLYLALFGSVLAFLLFYWLMQRIAVTNLLTISLITPPLAVLLGWFVAGETLSRWALLGAAFVLLGVALIVWKSARSQARQTLNIKAA
jgi:drug/metabolite transporter (DMT)-like permease